MVNLSLSFRMHIYLAISRNNLDDINCVCTVPDHYISTWRLHIRMPCIRPGLASPMETTIACIRHRVLAFDSPFPLEYEFTRVSGSISFAFFPNGFEIPFSRYHFSIQPKKLFGCNGGLISIYEFKQ